MAKHSIEARNEVLITNTIFCSGKGQPQTVALRVRGEANGKTIKAPVWMFGNSLPMPGEVVYLHSGLIEDEDGSNYRLLRNGKVSLSSDTDVAPAPPEPPIF